MDMLESEAANRPPNEDLLRGITHKRFNNGRCITHRTDKIRDLERRALDMRRRIEDLDREIHNLERTTALEVEHEYITIRQQDKRDIRLKHLSNADRRRDETERRLQHTEHPRLTAERDELHLLLSCIRIDIDFYRREWQRALLQHE